MRDVQETTLPCCDGVHDPGMSADHDYDPSWDYEVVETPPCDHVILVQLALDEAERTGLLATLRLARPNIFHTEIDGLVGAFGRYCDGTSSLPVIGLDLTGLQEWCDARGDIIEREVEATIAHELAHAWQDAAGLDQGSDECEAAAERFGQAWAYERAIAMDILQAAQVSVRP